VQIIFCSSGKSAFVIGFKTPPDLNRVVLETCSTGFTPWSRVQIAMLDDNEFKGS
jgi:hypothetical protein